MIVAIQEDYGLPNDLSSPRWAKLLEGAGHQVKWVDVYSATILDQLAGCDGFMWRHGHFEGMWHIARRLLPVVERELGLSVYPDQRTCWHYDDKIAQAHLLPAAGIPVPKTWVWFDGNAARAWAAAADYPMVLKLWSGACSENVRLVETAQDARAWIDKLFSHGVYNLSRDTSGPVRRLGRRVKKALRVLLDGHLPIPGEEWDLHKNYVLFQEFLPGNNWDERITVIGNRAFGFRRMNRPNDFRASGSGHIDFDHTQITEDGIRLGFEVAQRLDAQSVALDIVRKDGQPVVLEVSYTYANWAIHDCGGYWRLDGAPATGTLTWVERAMWPEEAQIEDFLVRLQSKGRSCPAGKAE